MMGNTKALFIESSIDNHRISKCGRTMTVGELIALLEQHDKDLPVYLIHDDGCAIGYAYGSILDTHGRIAGRKIFEEDIPNDEC